ncbi:dentilisin complex subunit PrcB [Treponema denticola]|uniref:dentilisin complex subunit PrcB n=1 Tax=Treponema denticola TaxID=158 RepID=UPI0021077AA7|nr:dentilisin complex subunit PrcB [Treponema denticola]UTY24852.1 dentilisin complex subunit PrcB [Treponema denticola]
MNIKYFYTILFLGLLVSSCTSLKQAQLPQAEAGASKVITSAASIETIEADTVHYELLMSGNNAKNGIDQIIREQGQLDNLYSILYGNNRKAPKIDFSRKAVIVLTCGPFNTGGYSIEIISVIKKGNSIELLWEVKTPEPWDIVTQAITRPYGIFSVDAEQNGSILIKCLNDTYNGSEKSFSK